jgi:redox-sensitive bicupin YhaK (pirin superfamily)
MIHVRSADQRGRTRIDWLDSRHTFSFGDYHDPANMGFGPLRVINDDRVEPGRGFGTHGHRDMEILSYVLEGALEHRDSLGTGSVIHPGEVQIMSAGTGIQHSEFNPSRIEPVHFLQIWIVPERRGLPPRYDQQAVALDDGSMHEIASPAPGQERSRCSRTSPSARRGCPLARASRSHSATGAASGCRSRAAPYASTRPRSAPATAPR